MATEAETVTLHASCVAVRERGVLMLGASGSGKSGLALRLMALGATLVADDRVIVSRRGAGLVASSPVALRGLVEARGVGLLSAAHLDECAVVCAVDLDQPTEARMPQLREIAILDVRIELILGHGVPNLDATLVQMLHCGRAM